MLGFLTKDQHQDTFKLACEKTLSSPAGLYHTMWTAMAKCDYFAEFQCIMLGLPFVYEFFCQQWLRGIDIMIEKKTGVRKIHTLRLIKLLEADFKSSLKIFFAENLMTMVEGNSALAEEQWGLINK